MDVSQILSRLKDIRRSGDGWTALCSAHDDNRASLSVNVGNDGRVLLHCHAGCSVEAIVQAIGLDMSDLFPSKSSTSPQKNRRVVATYDYEDESGKLLYQVVRYEPKDFCQRRPDGKGGWHYNLKETPRVLYRLPEILEQPELPVYVGEGEKDADNLVDIGIPTATTSPEGAGKWRSEYSEMIRGRSVVIFQHNDTVGRKHASDIASSCYSAGCPVRIVDLPGLSLKGDVTDWIAAGGTSEELFEIVNNTPIWEPSHPTPSDDPQAEIEAWLAGESSDIDVIKKHLQGLDAIQYDRLRNNVAEHAGIRVSTLDDLVKSVNRESKSTEVQGGSIGWEEIIPWSEPVDGAQLLDELVSTFRRFIVLPEGAVETLALWTVHTHAHEAAFISPYLALRSPEKRCGKTLTLQLLSALVPKPLPASNITPSALFRAVDKWHPTLLVDEADTFIRRNDELAGILNSGHTKASAWVVRTVQIGDDFEPRRFSTWAAKGIALIGNLKDTLQDRSIVISMRRKTREEKVERLRLDRVEEFETLRRKVARWVADYFDKMTNADPKVPRSLNDREQDNWRPLLAIADLAGCKWPARARQAAETLSGYSDADDGSIKVQLLQDIHDAFEEAGYPKAMKTVDLLSVLHEAEDRPWCEWKKGKPMSPHSLATQLRPYGIKPTQIRFGEESLKGYYLETFLDAFSRYLPPQSETNETFNNNNDLLNSFFETRAQDVSDRASRKRNNNNTVSDVSDRSPAPGGDICKDVDFFPLVKTQKNCCCDCCHFIPDPVNPPQGIGQCKVDAPYSSNDPARYPKAKRHCKQFVEAEMVT